jgi:hypothetical protein
MIGANSGAEGGCCAVSGYGKPDRPSMERSGSHGSARQEGKGSLIGQGGGYSLVRCRGHGSFRARSAGMTVEGAGSMGHAGSRPSSFSAISAIDAAPPSSIVPGRDGAAVAQTLRPTPSGNPPRVTTDGAAAASLRASAPRQARPLPIRGRRFPRSHGPTEDDVNHESLTLG